MRTDKEWMREDTWHFEVEVLRIYGRQELWSHGFGARSKFPRRSFSRERSPTSTGGPRACYRRRGKLSDGGSSLSTLVGTASSASALGVRGLLRSIGRNKLFSISSPRRPLAAPAPSLPLPAGGYGSRGRAPDTTGRAVPLTGLSEGVLGGRLQATHCGSPQSRSRTNIHKDQPTMPAGTTPPSSPTPDTQRLHLPNSTEGSPTLNPATS
ncbi:hypothetical protein THAOC_02142 [Thalassiosira oceanica]|uniref:DUF6743 domain-containing protein n=1 Tax=Thalassiosira oceanica TaxID=159749 RepID=K0TBL8_THAOC|nr:hypothetical protein THAOC_02142 [Thalassiosira oceanica]|eukprot:EJK76113.1 hypothetical protein THAOC_02142 [Thalassiosira oceanica]